jgi:endonuclease-8
MAEGDTILRLARRIEAALGGEQLAASAPSPRGRAAGVERLDGRRLERAEARGKHLLLCFGDLVLHSHLAMSGGWHIYPCGASWRRARSQAWVVLAGAEQEAVEFGEPTLRLPSASRLRHDPQLVRLAPDVLAADFEPEPVAYRQRGPCPVCGGKLSSRGQGDANRTTYWCPRCQA